MGTDPFDSNDDYNRVFPVELLSFGATLDNKDVKVDWVTATEVNTAYFEIERRTDDTDFQSMGIVAAAYNSNQRIDYDWIDMKPPSGNLYYRLKQVDVDGKFTYSKVVSVYKEPPSNSLQFYPNPAKSGDFLTVTMDIPIEDGGEVRLVDMSGRIINFWKLEPGSIVEFGVELPKLAAGSYVLQFSFDNRLVSKKLMIGF